MKPIDASTTQTLYIGYAGESNHTVVAFPTHCLTDSPENGTFTLFVQRNGDEQAYPAPITVEDGKVLWTVREVDAAKIGHGEVQLVFTVPGETAKSKIWQMNVHRSLTVSEDQPEPSQDWVNTVIEAADRAEQSASDIKDMMVSAVTLPGGSEPTVTKTKEEGQPYNLEFGIPQSTVPIAQTTGQSTTDVMSQKAVTDVTNAINQAISLINALIPSAASSTNKLADKNFVNSSISTNTANYISYNGNPFPSLAALQSYTGTVTNNDYAFVTGTDEYGNTYFDRYKATVSGSSVSWAKEYRLNNSSFTSDQWAAINSGITSSVVEQIIEALDTIAELQRKAPEWDAKYAKPTDGIPATDLEEDVQDTLETAESAFTTIEDTDVYLFRESAGGKEIGNRELLNKLVGGTICWNQILPISDTSRSTVSNDVTFTDNRDGTYSVYTESIGATDDTFCMVDYMTSSSKGGHVVYLGGCPTNGSEESFYIMDGWDATAKDIGQGVIYKLYNEGSYAGAYEIRVCVKNGTIITTPIVFKPHLIDFTQMFGSTIADYIYSLEQSHAGDGMAFVKPFIENADKSYNAGELVSVKTSAHVIKDANDVTLGTYLIDNIELRGIPKLDVNNKLYYDGDTYEADGTVTRRFGVYTFTGSERTAVWADGLWSVAGSLPGHVIPVYSSVPINAVSDGFSVVPYNKRADNIGARLTVAPQSSTYPGAVIIAGAETAADTLAMFAGKTIVYELASPTTESADPYTNPQMVDPDGTEAFEDERDVPMPVQAETKYISKSMGKAVGDFIGVAIPPMPQTGTYALKSTNGVLSWIAE